MRIILASNSPRRRELLDQVGICYEVIPSEIEENITKTRPEDVVKELAMEKTLDVAKRCICEQTNTQPMTVIGADTIVAYNEHILGKPKDAKDALKMLTMLSGQTHQVYTGVALARENLTVDVFAQMTEVTMYENTREQLMEYIATGEPMDKAGSYGIQGLGAVLVSEIQGDYNNVVGLPVAEVYRRMFLQK